MESQVAQRHEALQMWICYFMCVNSHADILYMNILHTINLQSGPKPVWNNEIAAI